LKKAQITKDDNAAQVGSQYGIRHMKCLLYLPNRLGLLWLDSAKKNDGTYSRLYRLIVCEFLSAPRAMRCCC